MTVCSWCGKQCERFGLNCVCAKSVLYRNVALQNRPFTEGELKFLGHTLPTKTEMDAVRGGGLD